MSKEMPPLSLTSIKLQSIGISSICVRLLLAPRPCEVGQSWNFFFIAPVQHTAQLIIIRMHNYISMSHHMFFFYILRSSSIFSTSVWVGWLVSQSYFQILLTRSLPLEFINFVFPVWIDSCMINGIAMQWLEGDASTLATVITFVTQSDLNSMYFDEPVDGDVEMKKSQRKMSLALLFLLLKNLHCVCLTLTVDYKQ